MIGAVLLGAMGVSCSTSYDSYGNRQQSVNPAGVAIGAVALGALAYSIGKDDGKRKEHRRHTKYDDRFTRYNSCDSHGYQDSGRRGYSSHGTSYGGGYYR
jgi:hypothetical protein